MKHQWKNKVDELLRRAERDLDGIETDGSREPDVESQVALANIMLAVALMQHEVTYQSRTDAPERA